MAKDIYLLCQYIQKPKPGTNTAQKGFGNNPDNWQFDEVIAVSRGLKKRDMSTQSVILNMSTQKVERCGLRQGATWDELYAYYKEHYPEYIKTIEKEIERSQPSLFTMI